MLERSLLLFATLCTWFCFALTAESPAAKSWIAAANDPSCDFPLQNLPYGVFRLKGSADQPRIGVAIGASVLDLRGCLQENLLGDLHSDAYSALNKTTLNSFMSLDQEVHQAVRQKIITLLEEGCSLIQGDARLEQALLLPLADIELLMPIDIGDYTDFYASIQHATHVGSIMRPDNPLMPNYKHMPIGYHGRSSSVVITGTPIAWPAGQINTQAGLPQWGISNSLDYELELGAVIGKGNHLGNPIPIHQAGQHIFGFVLLNDWSARDIQKWEYQPLGPFNGKNFASTISPWVVTKEALEPFEIAADHHERMPPLLSYLVSPANHNLDISVEAYLSSADMRKAGTPPLRICQGNTKDLYWTFDQMTCHHTVSGCNLRPGDLLGSGTISGSTKDSLGCLLERLAFKLPPLELPDGTTRQYLKEGDEIILRAYTSRPGYPRIGFGECRGIVSTKS